MTTLNYSSSKQIPWSCPWCRVRCNHCIGRLPSHPAQVSETNMFPFTKITAQTFFFGVGPEFLGILVDMGLFSLRILIIGWPKNEGLEEDHFFSGLLPVMCHMNIQLRGFPHHFLCSMMHDHPTLPIYQGLTGGFSCHREVTGQTSWNVKPVW